MEYKCLNCGTEMIVHNQIKLDMIDNPYIGQIIFECPKCRHYRKSAFPIASIFEARDRIDAGESVLGCDNFDDFLKKIEEEAWNNHVKNWKEWEDKKDIIREIEQIGHHCKNCKYTDRGLCDEPCSSCDIRLGNNKWKPKEGEDE